MIIYPGAMRGTRKKNVIKSLPGLLTWYDSVLSNPVLATENKIERIADLSGNGFDLRVRTENGKIHPTYDANAFGSLPGIGNSLVGQKVELRGDVDIRPYVGEYQTWYFVYRPYRITGLRILSLGSNYETPIDHSSGLMWGRSQDNGFPKTNLSLVNGGICTCLFNNNAELILRVNGVPAANAIDPRDSYLNTVYVKNIHLFTGYNLNAVEGVFGAAIFCMDAHSLPIIESVERYLSARFSIPLNT